MLHNAYGQQIVELNERELRDGPAYCRDNGPVYPTPFGFCGIFPSGSDYVHYVPTGMKRFAEAAIAAIVVEQQVGWWQLADAEV